MENKQTAVEWLREKLFKDFGLAFSDNIFEEAKKIEKKQMHKVAEYWHFNGIPDEVFDDYYDEMFIWSSFPNENS
jgi:hypothetical protein